MNYLNNFEAQQETVKPDNNFFKVEFIKPKKTSMIG